MVFSSNVFLFLFLPVFLAGYHALPFRWRSAWILVGSYAFYGWWRVDFLALFFAVTAWAWVAGQRVARAVEDGDARRANRATAVGVAGPLASLAWFKYAGFGLANISQVRESLGFEGWDALQILLPIGISFYVFQAISYVVDVRRGDAETAHGFVDFSAFIAMFPQLIAGPVLRYKDVADQFRHRAHDAATLSEGAVRFMGGFIKKVLVADAVAPLVGVLFDAPDPTLAESWLAMGAYTVQLYFDFSGYSDMAIGLGLMMGFRFPENFAHPYLSRSITEFWRRWHISLSTWLRDYLYIPLGGNRGSEAATYRNLMATMVLGGLWHGANWTFVVWGTWHGALLALERRFTTKVDGVRHAPNQPFPVTLGLVMLGWVVFRADDVFAAFDLYGGLVGLHGLALRDAVAWQLPARALTTLAAGGVLVFVLPRWQARGVGRAGRLALVPLFVLAVLRLEADRYSPFLYFQF